MATQSHLAPNRRSKKPSLAPPESLEMDLRSGSKKRRSYPEISYIFYDPDLNVLGSNFLTPVFVETLRGVA